MMFIRDPNAALKSLLAVLGEERVAARLAKFERDQSNLQAESIFAQWWFTPQNSVWLSLRGARQVWTAGRSVNDVIEHVPPIGIYAAALVEKIAPTMPDWRRSKLVGDLCTSEQLRSVLLELDVAADFVERGYELQWLDDRGKEGVHIAEFVAIRNGSKIGVECKATSLDAGRLFHRKHACLLADKLLPVLSEERKLTGTIQISFRDWTPTSPQGQQEVVREILRTIDAPSDSAAGSRALVAHDLRPRDGETINLAAFVAKQRTKEPLRSHFGSFTVVAARHGSNGAHDPIVFQFGSTRRDRIERAIKDNLRKASEQLRSLGCPGVIYSFVPEIDDFNDPEVHPFLVSLGDWFFGNPDRSHVLGIRFASDFKIGDHRNFGLAEEPFAMIANPKRLEEAKEALS